MDGKTDLSWGNVGIGFAFIAFDVLFSAVLGVNVGGSLFSSAIRCIIQLSIMALVLQSVFHAKSPWAVAGLTLLLVLLGTFEVIVNKSKLRFRHMMPAVFIAMFISTVPVSILGVRFAMSQQPFWYVYTLLPKSSLPILGMLCGGTISAIVVATNYVLKELEENRDKIETYLAFGASRFEACKPVVVEGLRLALLPTINQMSVIGLISIPGMMTGALLGGASVDQAAKLQMVIMFMINASATLAAMTCTVFAMSITVDGEHRVRSDRILREKHAIWRGRDKLLSSIGAGLKNLWGVLVSRAESLIGRSNSDSSDPTTANNRWKQRKAGHPRRTNSTGSSRGLLEPDEEQDEHRQGVNGNGRANGSGAGTNGASRNSSH
ncbi:UPF0014-domain-containing protein [Clavulina sp. PMI_390]|nr:UPF0014-domain-containing protein [Clavulina sp. PMI_390]